MTSPHSTTDPPGPGAAEPAANLAALARTSPDPPTTAPMAASASPAGPAPSSGEAASPARRSVGAVGGLLPRVEPPELLPARALNEFTYCPRLGFLEWVDGEFAESADTLEGTWRHRRVDRPSGQLPSPGEGEATRSRRSGARPDEVGGDQVAAGEQEEDSTTIHARSVMLSAPRLGLIARIDLVEATGEQATPVDYKRGEKPDIPEGAWEPERVQVCAQGLILEENGFRCERAVIYFVGSRSRVEIPLDAALRRRTLEQIEAFRRTAERGAIPPPLTDSPRCPRCSLVTICLPDEVNLLRLSTPQLPTPSAEALQEGPSPGGAGQQAASEPGSKEVEEEERVRRLLPARDDALPLYVQEQGTRVGKTGDCLKVEPRTQAPREVRLLETSQVCLFGGVQISTQAVQELLTRGIPLCYFSHGGWFYGMTQGMPHKNVQLRRLQFAAAGDERRCLELARGFVASKIRNCRTLLRRNTEDVDDGVLASLRQHAQQAEQAASLESLLGIEGNAARLYFSSFARMIKADPADGGGPLSFVPEGRNRRPPRDPVNALLSFAYAMLTKDLTITLQAVGFDPLLGFYHQPRYGRPALALDLMEEFRPIVGDSVAITVINNREVRLRDFTKSAGAVNLSPAGRKSFIQAYERRMDQLVTHPVFGYRISYRRVLEVQARLLGRYLAGEISEYPAFSTR